MENGIRFGNVLALVSILTSIHAILCAGAASGRSYGDRTTPEAGPTTLEPAHTCDLSDLECQGYRHADRPSFWKNQKSLLSLPNSHRYDASEPIEVLTDGSVVIQNEIVTNWGNWLSWRECPKGMFAMGSEVYHGGTESDYNGVFYINFLCRTPGRNETNHIIEACAPNACPQGRPSSSFKKSRVCTGPIIGFSLNVPPPRRNGADQVGTDGFNSRCSTSAPKKDEHFGRAISKYGWTEYVHCNKHQAMCGFQAQMQDYIPTRDNTAMNNLRIKCCPVLDPLEDCVPTEERVLIRKCDNSNSAEGLRCEYDSLVGLSVDYGNEKALTFYFSIGYDFFSIKDKMKEKIFSYLRNNKEYTMEYPWDAVSCNVERPETSSIKTICVGPYESMELYQIVGKCGYFWVRTNRFLKIITINGRENDEYFHVD